MSDISDLEIKRSVLTSSIENEQRAIDNLYDNSMSVMQDKLELSAEKARVEYQQKTEDFKQEYLKTLSDLMEDFGNRSQQMQNDLENLNQVIKQKEALITAHVELNKRQTEEKEKINYYKIALSKDELEEIQNLREISSKFIRSKDSINKIIWDVYLKTPTKEMLNRIVSAPVGIYKITNLLNNKVYIGQSVDLQERIRTHIRSGIGASTTTSNAKLYKAIKEDGIENFKFEILEYCDKNLLNEKEKYWINQYQSHSYGYNSTVGNG